MNVLVFGMLLFSQLEPSRPIQDLRQACVRDAVERLDRDEHLEWYKLFAACLQGPSPQALSPCWGMDFDRDGSIDLRDFAILQNAW